MASPLILALVQLGVEAFRIARENGASQEEIDAAIEQQRARTDAKVNQAVDQIDAALERGKERNGQQQ